MANENFLTNKTEFGTGAGTVSNLLQGAQLGLGFKAGAFDAATPLAFPPAVIVVMQTPSMYKEQGLLSQTIKAMFECHAKSVTGIDVSYTVEATGQPVGHDGQELVVPTKTKRTAPSPTFVWPEVLGNLVWNILKRWCWDMNDPDTNAGMEFLDNPDPYTLSSYALSFMAIQFDQTMIPDRIIDAAFFTNVFPQGTGELGMKREIGQTTVQERSATFNAYQIHNNKTKEIGIALANEMSLRNNNYISASPSASKVDGKIKDNGLVEDLKNLQADSGVAATADVSSNWNKTAPAN